MALRVACRQILFNDIPELASKARANPRRSILILLSFLFALIALSLLMSRLARPIPKALTKAQEDKERHATKKICGAEYEEKAEQIRASCEEIKKRKDRLSPFLFNLFHDQVKDNGGIQQMCCKDGCNQIELEESLCWEAPLSPPLSSSHILTLVLLIVGGISVVALALLAALWAYRRWRTRSGPVAFVPLV